MEVLGFAAREGLQALIMEQWPQLSPTPYWVLTTDSCQKLPALQFALPNSCPYNYLHIEFRQDTVVVDADGDYGSLTTVEYADPLAFEKVLEFIRLIMTATTRRWMGEEAIAITAKDVSYGVSLGS